MPRTSRPCACRCRRRRGLDATRPPPTSRTRPTRPTIATLVDHLNARFPARGPPLGGRRHAQERPRHGRPHPDGTRETLAIGLPGDREVDEKRLGAQVDPPRRTVFEDFAAPPGAGQGLHRPRGARRRASPPASATSLDPRVVDGHRVGHRRRPARPPRHRPRRGPRLHRRRHHRGRRGARRRRVPELRAPAGGRARHRDGPHLPARQEVRRGARTSRCSTRTASSRPSPWAPTASASRGPSRRSPRATTTSSGSCWPREIAPADVHVVATGKDDERLPQGARRSSASSRPRASRCIYDDRRQVSPGVKFKDSELIGVPTIVVVGRGLADGTIEVKDRRSGERRVVPVDSAVARWSRRSAAPATRRHDRPSGGGTQGTTPAASARSSSTGAARSRRGTGRHPEQWRVFAREVHGILDEPDVPGLAEDARRPRILGGGGGGVGARPRRGRLGRASTTSSPRPGSSPTTRAPWRASPHTRRSGSRTPGPTRRCGHSGKGCATTGSGSACCRTRSGPGTTTAACFERDGVLDLVDADVYSSETPWVKPHPEIFRDGLRGGLGVEPARCVYVGDRGFEDVHGPQSVGMRAILVPHSDIPASQQVASRRDARRRGPRAARRPRHRRLRWSGRR